MLERRRNAPRRFASAEPVGDPPMAVPRSAPSRGTPARPAVGGRRRHSPAAAPGLPNWAVQPRNSDREMRPAPFATPVTYS
jgi:hypothetical protein